VVATPHVGGATLEAGRRAALAAAALVLDVLAQETDRS
jgi:phosphoglycerate dehydrogenase-like enzyme